MILTAPAAFRFAVATVAESWLVLIKDVVNAAPFQRTTELVARFVPVTLSVNPGPPTMLDDGDNCASAGAGLSNAPLSFCQT